MIPIGIKPKKNNRYNLVGNVDGLGNVAHASTFARTCLVWMTPILIHFDYDDAVRKHKRQVGSLASKSTSPNQSIIRCGRYLVGTQLGKQEFPNDQFGSIRNFFVACRTKKDACTRTFVTNSFFCAEVTLSLLIEKFFKGSADVTIVTKFAMSTIITDGTLIFSLPMLTHVADFAMIFSILVLTVSPLL